MNLKTAEGKIKVAELTEKDGPPTTLGSRWHIHYKYIKAVVTAIHERKTNS